MTKKTKMLFLGNDWRTKQLEDELEKRVAEFSKIEFDPVSFIYKCLAALLTFHPNKLVWWIKYQWHPIIQSGRRKKVLKEIEKRSIDFDVLFMWSSWFNPLKGSKYENKPFYYYTDQSCNKKMDVSDIVDSKSMQKARLKFNNDQFESYTQCKKVFCMSEWTKNQTLESHNKLSKDKVVKVGWGPIGINLLGENITYNKEIPVVLFIGHEFYRKGIDVLREAIPLVAEQFPHVVFKIVGENFDKLYVEPHPNLSLLGGIKDINVLKDLYREAKFFVLPHRFERAGHVLIEAMSAGKPIITSNQGGPKDVVLHGKNGYVVEIGDSKSLAKYIIELLSNDEKCLAYGKEGRKIVTNGYTWDKVAEKILEHILER